MPAQNVEVRRNLSTSPNASFDAQGWFANDVTGHDVVLGTAVPAPHPLGLTTCARINPKGAMLGGTTAASQYSMDGFDAVSGTLRGIGFWIWAPFTLDVQVWFTGDAGSQRNTRVPANTWAFVLNKYPSTGLSVVVAYRADGKTVAGTDYVYMTGSIAEAGKMPESYFDGNNLDTSLYDFAWLGAVNKSGSVQSAKTTVRTNMVTDPKILTASFDGVTPGTGAVFQAVCYSENVVAAVGETWTVSCDFTAPAGSVFNGLIHCAPTTGVLFGANPKGQTAFSVPAGETRRFYDTYTIPVGADGLRLLLSNMAPTNGTAKISNVMIEKTDRKDPYFDGNGSDGFYTYAWVGAALASASQQIKRLASIGRTDMIMEELIAAGYNTGTINDRERKRLLAKAGFTVLQGERYTLQDLYRVNNERPRI